MRAPAPRTMPRAGGGLGRRLFTALVLAAAVSDVGAQAIDCAKPASGRNFANQTLALVNFARVDLRNANFRGATLKGVSFIRANLRGADFSGATFVDSGNPGRSSDFSFARLDSACFVGTKFQAPTYFTYATLTAVDFSNTNLATGNAIFGDQPLIFDATPPTPRPRFRYATMNCEFVAQWNQLDLTGAGIKACSAQLLPGHDFSGAQMAGVNFDGLDLTRSNWRGAVLDNASFAGATLDVATGWSTANGAPAARLSGAVFTDASVKGVDFTEARLYGARFTRANLENSRLQNALLTNNPDATAAVPTPANFESAHLKNVDLSGAQLNSVSFRNANFYGSFNVLKHGPPNGFPCQLNTRPPASCGGRPTGFTCGCATASGANLTRTDFTGAFLYGTDFGGLTRINGTVFTNAVLVAASFNGASFMLDPKEGGAPVALDGAYLQGADFTGVQLPYALLTGAYIDVRPGGNVLQVLLPGSHSAFKGWKAQGTRVCVNADYSGYQTRVPITTTTTTCPDGLPGSCGLPPGTPPTQRWRSPVAVGNADPPGYYVSPPTYGTANQTDPACNAAKVERDW